ncbi:MAG: TRAP transporter large permease subunit [Burkholderiales bacterium]|nr:TRAP transporter large permease subunit [Burkholderiales bacterium]MCA3224578.1 TRAP transporter large permease subunit [Burkholderiales bacterium]
MTAFELMAPLMFAGLVVFLLLGYPVAFALAANGMLFAFIGIELGMLNLSLLQALPDRVFSIMSNQTLLAIPFFTFMGIVLEKSGMAEDLLDTIGKLFGPIRGGVAYAVIFVGALLAATTGVVAASVIAMGLISLPVMLRYGYNKQIASGVICASGTLAQIIPPSLVLIVLADVLGVSVGDMYEGALLPGLILVGMLALFILLVSLVKPNYLPTLPKNEWMPRAPAPLKEALVDHVPLALVTVGLYFLINAGIARDLWVFMMGMGVALVWIFVFSRIRKISFAAAMNEEASPLFFLVIMTVLESSEVINTTRGFATTFAVFLAILIAGQMFLGTKSHNKVIAVMAPPLVLIFLVLGTIFLGVATPTEGGAMGAVGALALAALRSRLDTRLLKQAMDATLKLTTFVVFILIGSTIFALTFRGVNGDIWVENLFALVPGGVWGFIVVVNIIVFILGFFIDFFEIAFILLPLLAPIAQKLDVNMVWFGVMIAMNMQTSFLTPPFGFALFYLRSVAPKEVTTIDIYKGVVPFVTVQLIALALTIGFPRLVLDFDALKARQQAPDKSLDDAIPTGPAGGAPSTDPTDAFRQGGNPADAFKPQGTPDGGVPNPTDAFKAQDNPADAFKPEPAKK